MPKAKKKAKAKARSKTKTKAKSKAKSKSKARVKSRSRATAAHEPSIKPTAALKRRALDILHGLNEEYPDAHCELNFTNGLELLIGTILAAQCTDKRVNMVTEDLFKKYRTAQDWLDSPDDTIREEIRSTGFFNNKTKSIKKAMQSLVDQFDGEVPDTMEELLKLGGVGRKTANCILGNVFNVPGVVVDTHMLRIQKRMGFTTNTDATKVEFDVMAIFPKDRWINLSHLIPWHGRRTCSARKPNCDGCAVSHVCPRIEVE